MDEPAAAKWQALPSIDEQEVTDPTAISALLRHVVDRYPARAALILRMATTDEEFRSLCEDYALAMNTLLRMEALDQKRIEHKIAEYRAIIDDLEREIGRALVEAGEVKP